jgi:hypothetical protein
MSHKTNASVFYAAIAVSVIVALYLLLNHAGQESWIHRIAEG